MSPEISLGTPAREQHLDPRTAEAFMKEAGERYGFKLREAQNLFADSKTLSPDDPFHNYEHHLDSLWAGIRLIDHFAAKGIYIDAKAVVVALMRHDTQNPNDPSRDNHKFPEILSAALLISDYEKDPQRYGLSDHQVIKAADLIISTAKDAVIDSDEKAIMVLADLDNVGREDDSIFNNRTALFRNELELKGKIKPEEDKSFRESTVVTLSTYFLKLWQRDRSFEWLRYAQRNILSYIQASASEAGTTSSDYVACLKNPAVSQFFRIASSNDSKNTLAEN